MRIYVKGRWLLAGWLGSAVLAAGAAQWNAHRIEERVHTEAKNDANRCVLVFTPAEVHVLTGSASDQTLPSYQTIRDRLTHLRTVNPHARSVHVLRKTAAKAGPILLLDSSPSGSELMMNANRGSNLSAAAADRGNSNTGDAVSYKFDDVSGACISAYAPIDGAVRTWPRDFVGIDLDASGLGREMLGAGAQAALFVILLLGVPLTALMILARKTEQDNTIRKLRQVVDECSSAILICSPTGVIEYANRGICEISGFSRDEFVGHNWREFRTDRTPPEVFEQLAATLKAGHTWHGEWINQRRNGDFYHVRARVSPVFSAPEKISHYINVMDDITDVKRMQAELISVKDRAEAGDRAKGRFLAMMSHEIRTPLNGVIGFATLLLDGTLTHEQRDAIQSIQSSGEALLDMTNKVLDYSKIDAGRLLLQPEAIDPRLCIEEVFDLFAVRAAGRKIELLHWVDDNVPSLVLADLARLRQVLMNLVGNSLKFTESGEVEVRLKAIPELGAETSPSKPETCILQFSVRDTGIGIATEDHSKLFIPFNQVDDLTTRKFAGTGLGLAISKSLVRAMGGEITVVSEANLGALFTFTIEAPAAAPVPTYALDKGMLRRVLAVFSPHKLLRSELVRLARRWGFHVVEPSFKALPMEEWDIALVDLSTESWAEWEQRFNEDTHLANRQFIAFVPVDFSPALRESAKRYFSAVINKPVHHDVVRRVISMKAEWLS